MRYEVKNFENTKILIRYPNNFEKGKRYPAILFLHGAGYRGEDIEHLKTNPYFTVTQNYENFPFISVAPICNDNSWFDLFPTLKNLAKSIFSSSIVDSNRFYLIGGSMGAYGAYQLAMSLPELFAALVPICGGGMYWSANRLVNVPTWAFHGKLDPYVLPRESEIMVERINKNGGNAKLTLYEDVDHCAWTPTYSNYEVFEWLLSNSNQNAKEIINMYKNPELFG